MVLLATFQVINSDMWLYIKIYVDIRVSVYFHHHRKFYCLHILDTVDDVGKKGVTIAEVKVMERRRERSWNRKIKLLLREASLFLKPVRVKGREAGKLRSIRWVNLKL